MCDDFSGVFHNDLVWLKGSIAAHPISTIRCLDDLNSDVVLAASFRPVLEFVEVSVSTLWSKPAITTITLVKHVSILAVFVTASVLVTHAS